MLFALLNVLNISMIGMIENRSLSLNGRWSRQSNEKYSLSLRAVLRFVAVRVPGGFAFYASDDRFEEMDGHTFPRARAIERQLKRVARRRPKRPLQWVPSFS